MPKHNFKTKERFFTIKTPRKDGSILDLFLSEFGYAAFESEDRQEDTRRSVKQVSTNEELIAEMADFCKDNGCKIALIYKEGKVLKQKHFQGKTAYEAKDYKGSEDIVKEIEANEKEAFKEANRYNNSPQNNNQNPPQSNNRQGNNKNPRYNKKNNDKDVEDFINSKTRSNNKNRPNNKKKTPNEKANKNNPNNKKKTPNEKANMNNPNHPSHPDHPENKKNKPQNNKKKRPQANRKKHIGVMSDKPPREITDKPVEKKQNVTIQTKKRRVVKP